MSTIFLIGMPGAGKTHWGRIWSRVSGFRLHDLDRLIEDHIGMSIPSIMQDVGEPGFRRIESDVLASTVRACRGENTIIACGGGTPTIPANLELMLRSGCVVYLEAPDEMLLRQLRKGLHRRPLLKNPDLESVNALLQKRKYYYEQAHVIISLNNAHSGTFAQILEACTNRHL